MNTFFKDMLERAIKTAAQSLLANLAVGASLSEVNWGLAFSTTAVATIISVLTSIASYKVGDTGTAGTVKLN